MSDTILVALISAVVSLIVSLFAGTLQRRFELRRIRQEHEHGYAKALFEKRVEYYPELYNYLSEYQKIIRNNKQTIENLAEVRTAVDGWNSKHSLFFTRYTSKYSAKCRQYLAT